MKPKSIWPCSYTVYDYATLGIWVRACILSQGVVQDRTICLWKVKPS